MAKVLMANGPLWRPTEPVRPSEEEARPEFFEAIRTLLATGTGAVALHDVSGDSETYWLGEPVFTSEEPERHRGYCEGCFTVKDLLANGARCNTCMDKGFPIGLWNTDEEEWDTDG